MAGQDQSANLGGMLTDIGKTMGSMGDAYKPVLQAATKPRGDMNDPAHLANLAQWATQHGDTAAASMYMSQAREAKADQKEQKSMDHMAMSDQATMTGNMTAEQIAQSGDVTNLDRSIAALTERMQGDFPSIQARNYAKANLDKLKSMREGAVGVQTQNHAKAVGSINKALEDPKQAERKVEIQNEDGTVTESTVGAELAKRRDELLKDPEVQDTLNKQAVERGRLEREQLALEGEKYLSQNAESLRDAIVKGDFDKVDDIVQDADGYKAQQAVRSFADAVTRESEARDARQVLEETQVVYDYKMIEEQVSDLDPTLLEAAGYNVALKRVEASEANRIGGKLTTTGHLTQASNARKAVEDAIAKARMTQAEAQYTSDLRKGEEEADEIAELEASLENYQPSDVDVARRYTELSRGSEVKRDSEGNPKQPELIYEQARADLRNEHRSKVNGRLSDLGVESAEPESPSDPYTTTGGLTVSPSKVASSISRDGVEKTRTNLQEAGFSDGQIEILLRENATEGAAVKEPVMYRREPGLPRDPFGLQSKYEENVAKMAARRSPQ